MMAFDSTTKIAATKKRKLIDYTHVNDTIIPHDNDQRLSSRNNCPYIDFTTVPFSMPSKPSNRTTDGLISGLTLNHNDVLREGGFINYQQQSITGQSSGVLSSSGQLSGPSSNPSPAGIEHPTSTPTSFGTASLDGYLGNSGHCGQSSNHSFDLLDSDSFSEMPNSLTSSPYEPYDYTVHDHHSNNNNNSKSLKASSDINGYDNSKVSDTITVRKKRKSAPHVRPSCPECGKEFSNQSALSKHKLTHSDERKFVCHQCAKAFKRQDHLNGHMLTHRSKKPYECDVEGCEKTYCDARSLRRHKENHHMSANITGISSISGVNSIGGVNPISGVNAIGGVNSISGVSTISGVNSISGVSSAQSLPLMAINFSNNSTAGVISNRIQYVPPQPISVAVSVNDLPSASSQLQLLALHQQENTNDGSAQLRDGQHKWNQMIIKREEPSATVTSAHTSAPQFTSSSSSSSTVSNTHENALLHQLLTQQLHYKDRQPLFQPSSSSSSSLSINQHPTIMSHLTGIRELPHQNTNEWPFSMFAQNDQLKNDPQQVECPLCQRRFKNIPALNGHMRLHGGYLKSQQNPNSNVIIKKENKTDNSQEQAKIKAIVDVIKQNIYRKHGANLNNSNSKGHGINSSPLPSLVITPQTKSNTSVSSSSSAAAALPPPPILSPVTPVTPINSGNNSNNNTFNYDFHHDYGHYNRNSQELLYNNEIQALREQLQREQFRIPSQPSNQRYQQMNNNKVQQSNVFHMRRHSDSGDSISTLDNDNNNNNFNNDKTSENLRQISQNTDQSNNSYPIASNYSQPYTDLLRRRTQRTCSDPGSEPLMTINTGFESQQQLYPQQFYHNSHSVPTTPTQLYHQQSPSNIQPQNYPHSLPSTPTAVGTPVTFAHSPSHRGSVPSTPTEGQHFTFIAVASPANVPSVQSHYSASPVSVAQYSPSPVSGPNTQYSPLPNNTQQFNYPVQQQQVQVQVQQPQASAHYHQETIQVHDNVPFPQHQQTSTAVMYDTISNYSNAGRNESQINTQNESQFNFGSNIDSSYYNHNANDMQMTDQQMNEQIDVTHELIGLSGDDTESVLPQNQQANESHQQIDMYGNYAPPPPVSSHSQHYPMVTNSGYVTRDGNWSNVKPNLGPIASKGVLPSPPPLVSLPPTQSAAHNDITTHVPLLYTPSKHIPMTESVVKSNIRHKSFSPPNLVVHLEKIDEENDETDDVFLSPIGVAPSPKRTSPVLPSSVASPKRAKHRPEPLYIPPHVNTSGYQSRLRSPRLWDPTAVIDNKNMSPPPYTPPPMLSPVRSGPGLFWHIINGNMTPKSGTVTPKFIYVRKSSSEKEKEGINRDEGIPSIVGTIQTPTTAYEPYDADIPETDIQPHVNIGPLFQARIPAFNSNKEEAKYRTEKANIVWDPLLMETVSDDEMESYLELACCACVPGSGRNKEYAYHLLYMCKGNFHDAIVRLLEPHPMIEKGHALYDYQYPENDIWVPQEIEAYHIALTKCDKDFFSIAKEVGTKTVKQCIQFYYMWKKVCPDEYRRQRLIRRKREQSIFYNLRSKEEENGIPTIKEENDDFTDNNNFMSENNNIVNSGHSSEIEDNASSLMDSANPSPATSVGSIAPDIGYPCKLCGKVFTKVKSRSAHMKIHGSAPRRGQILNY